jgi:hypothetical protein
MAFEVTYPTDCDEIEVVHTCDDCALEEGARVRSAFFILNTYSFADPTSIAEWQQAIEDGNVVIIPSTNGTYDGGTPNYGPGFGDQIQRYINSEFKVTYRDPALKSNWAFYEGKKKSSRWKFGFRTETLVWIGDEVCTIAPKNPVADDIKVGVVWEVEVSWLSRNSPEPFDMPETIFECFILSE